MAKLSPERMLAHMGAWLSHTGVRYRAIGRIINGPFIDAIAYDVSSTEVAEVPKAGWARIPGDPEAPIISTALPFGQFFRRGGIIEVNAPLLDEVAAGHPDHEPFIGFRFGETVMAAEVDEIPEQFGMAVGRGDNYITAGLINPESRSLIVPEGIVGTNGLLQTLRSIHDDGIPIH